jgi:hypothetical protein
MRSTNVFVAEISQCQLEGFKVDFRLDLPPAAAAIVQRAGACVHIHLIAASKRTHTICSSPSNKSDGLLITSNRRRALGAGCRTRICYFLT